MTRDEIKALTEMLTRSRDEFRLVADWLRTKDLDRGVQRVPALILRQSSMMDELLLMIERYARKSAAEDLRAQENADQIRYQAEQVRNPDPGSMSGMLQSWADRNTNPDAYK